jgi:NAD(P)H-flavin reductase
MLPADRFHRARITYRRDIAPDLWIIRLDPRGAFDFTPGAVRHAGPCCCRLADRSRLWEDQWWPGERGRVEDVLRKYTDLWQLIEANTTAYFCGHPLMMEHGIGIFERAGFAKASIKHEAYWVPKGR